ncbi:MAG: hypothetical protein ACLQLG_07250 [Thermoguttaceae bacterium]
MKEVALKQLVVGMTALMKVGAPVRMWMRSLRTGRRILTPAHYAPLSQSVVHVHWGMLYVEVKVARVMLPYAIVYHHNGHGWVRLWIDTRETALFAVEG